MRIFLNQIHAAGRSCEEVLAADQLDLPKEIVCLSPLTVSADFERAGQVLIGKFQVEGRYQCSCCRCTAAFELDKTVCFDLVFDIEPSTDFIDCDEDIRQEMIVAMALNPVCREDCQGLCPRCGADLNNETCQCNAGS